MVSTVGPCAVVIILMCYITPNMALRHFRIRLRQFRHTHCHDDMCDMKWSRYHRLPAKVSQTSRLRRIPKDKPLTLELAVFVDHALYLQFASRFGDKQADGELQAYVFALLRVVQSVYMSQSLSPKLYIKLVHYAVFKREPRSLSFKHHRGDMTAYLPLFCRLQRRINKRGHRWDHATLLSGHDLFQDDEKQFTGYATTHTICTPLSCSLVEARNFKSAYTLAHELGHSFGLQHDGVGNTCSSTCCVMSPIIAFGKWKWSKCSQKEYTKFLDRLNLDGRLDCLFENLKAGAIEFRDSMLPGQRYPIDEQCRNYFGSCYAHVLRRGDSINDVCQQTWCSNGGRYMNASHAALEGTHCGENRWCRSGRCVNADKLLKTIDGGWSKWMSNVSDADTGSEEKKCGSYECSKCRISGQIRLLKERRICNNPTANNGGKACKGPIYRATACDDEVCEGLSLVSYASLVCRHLKRKYPRHPRAQKFTGKGLQRKDKRSCVVWCHLTNSQLIYTLFDPFPDGTPCGPDDHYCVSGQCMEVACGGRQDCVLVNGKPPNNETFYETETIPPGTWSPWSEWTSCSRSCGQGLRKRQRHCTHKHACLGKSRRIQLCSLEHCPETTPTATSSVAVSTVTKTHSYLMTSLRHPHETESTSTRQWSRRPSPTPYLVTVTTKKQTVSTATSQKTTIGFATTIKNATATGSSDLPTSRSEKNTRTIPPMRLGEWTSWGSWSWCTATCGGGYRTGIRLCHPQGSRCVGINASKRRCNTRTCKKDFFT